ncbi:MAG: hypothetical protein J7K00_04855 [Candidatus Diapherotrites archaeon]|nr:hypothetical protein [Candidatus Diapherotrites archaeon]
MKNALKGQAFDTFKLLIAAIVAISILGVMMGIIGGTTLPGSDPNHEIKSKLSSAVINAGNTVTTSTIKFKFGDTYCITALKGNSGLDDDQIDFDVQHNGIEISPDDSKCIQAKSTDVNGRAAIKCDPSTATCTITIKPALN